MRFSGVGDMFGRGGGGRQGVDAAAKYQRWDKNSDAARFLYKSLKSGEIGATESPKTVHERYPLFQPYKLDSFRTQLNKAKTELGLHIRRDGAGCADDTRGGRFDDALDGGK